MVWEFDDGLLLGGASHSRHSRRRTYGEDGRKIRCCGVRTSPDLDVDALYGRGLAAGYQPTTVPRDAEWGERYFHLIDSDGRELSFARPLLSSV
jgi:uncharacterized glyoxalase superfamily protein PhnB